MKPLFPEFNTLIDKIVKNHKLKIVLTPFPELCDTLEKITRFYNTHNSILIWTGASENTIWGNKETNWNFRAWHDYIHIQYQLPFTPEGESTVCQLQKHTLLDYNISALYFRILDAEINGQIAYEKKHGVFPKDQRKFVLDYLGM